MIRVVYVQELLLKRNLVCKARNCLIVKRRNTTLSGEIHQSL